MGFTKARPPFIADGVSRYYQDNGRTYYIKADAPTLPPLYPKDIPYPAFVDGRLSFFPLGGGFSFNPTATELAWMMLLMQQNITKYAAKNYDIFAKDTSDTKGVQGLAAIIIDMVKFQRVTKDMPFTRINYRVYPQLLVLQNPGQQGYGYWSGPNVAVQPDSVGETGTWVWVKKFDILPYGYEENPRKPHLGEGILYDSIDFLNPPYYKVPLGEKILTAVTITIQAIMAIVINLVPFVGSVASAVIVSQIKKQLAADVKKGNYDTAVTNQAAGAANDLVEDIKNPLSRVKMWIEKIGWVLAFPAVLILLGLYYTFKKKKGRNK